MAESDVMSAIQDFTAHTSGVVGVAAKHLETSERISHNADTVFFTASTLKVPLLVELYRQVDAGIIDVHQRIDLTDILRVPGSGVLKELASGLQPTVHDLAMLMIIISDNTATDILYNRVGGDNINNTMRQLGLTHTHIPMTCRELLYGITGLDVGKPAHTYQLASDRLKNREFVLEGDGFSEDKSDVSSPNDMCHLLELIYEGDILSPQSREAALGYPQASAVEHGYSTRASFGNSGRPQNRQLPRRPLRCRDRVFPHRSIHSGDYGETDDGWRSIERRCQSCCYLQGGLRGVRWIVSRSVSWGMGGSMGRQLYLPQNRTL